MKARKTICSLVCALLPLGPLALAPMAAQAQQYANERMPAPDIRGFDVEEVRRIAPGVELHFNLYGTPGGNATVKIDGATRNLRLHELDRGQYAGTYTIGTHDRIRNGSRVTADLRVGDRVASDVLRETLVRPLRRRSRGCPAPACVHSHIVALGRPWGPAPGGR
ncbi:MAG TPA: hypothetical protein DDZ22_06475, partial [Massilia sp.]|nr:hypothetical protein [Massilia sp.]